VQEKTFFEFLKRLSYSQSPFLARNYGGKSLKTRGQETVKNRFKASITQDWPLGKKLKVNL
jgi:hypothetical protein